jgi:tetratricopeptide (TPR) repeat protein
LALSSLWLLGLPGDWLLDDYSLPGLGLPSLARPRPLTYLTYWLQEQLNGPAPWAWRLGNIVLHGAAVQFCYRALRRLIGAERALVAAALFAVHPLQAEPVLYVFSRPVVLMGLLLWVALEQWLKGKHGWAFVFYGLALAAKEEAVAFPLLLGALHLSISHNAREWRWIGAMAAVAGVAGAGLLVASGQAGSGAGSQAGWTWVEYAGTQPWVIGLYLKQLVWPEFLGLRWKVGMLPGWGLALWLLPLGGLWFLRRWFAKAGPGFWAVAALVVLLPTSSVLPLADVAVARRCYLVVAMAGVAFSLAPRRWALAAVAAYALVSANWAASLYRDPAALWALTVERQGGAVGAVVQWTKYLSPAEALERLEQYRAPEDLQWQTERGRVLLELGRVPEALQAFGRALAIAPERASAAYNRGVALRALGQREAAEADFRRALELDPGHGPARRALGR